MRINLKRGSSAFLLIAFAVVVADQVSKFLIRSNIALGSSIPESGFIRLHHVQNTGAAFSILENHTSLLVVIGIIEAIFVVLAFLFSYRFPFLRGNYSKIVFGLLLGGIIGNLIDRIRLGYVTDFIDVSIWPTFNLADSAGVIGVIILIYLVLFSSHHKNLSDESD